MEKYQNFDDAILGLQNEVNKYSINNIKLSSSLVDSPIRNDEINILSSKSIPQIDFNKLMIVVPIIIFFLFIYFKPEFIMVEKPYDKKGKRINYSKLIITVSILSGLFYCFKYSF
jgi:hypothetical protein